MRWVDCIWLLSFFFRFILSISRFFFAIQSSWMSSVWYVCLRVFHFTEFVLSSSLCLVSPLLFVVFVFISCFCLWFCWIPLLVFCLIVVFVLIFFFLLALLFCSFAVLCRAWLLSEIDSIELYGVNVTYVRRAFLSFSFKPSNARQRAHALNCGRFFCTHDRQL